MGWAKVDDRRFNHHIAPGLGAVAISAGNRPGRPLEGFREEATR